MILLYPIFLRPEHLCNHKDNTYICKLIHQVFLVPIQIKRDTFRIILDPLPPPFHIW